MRKISLFTAIAAALLLSACAAQAPSAPAVLEPVDPQPATPLTFEHPAYHKITPAQAKALMDEGKAVVVDVRSPKEYAAGHIQGSVNVPLDTLVAGQKLEAAPDLNQKLLVHCRSGVRAEQASRILVETGYTVVNNMYGTLQWPYGFVNAHGEKIEQVPELN